MIVLDEGKTRGTAALCRIEGGALHPAKIPTADWWYEVDDDDVNINDNFMIVNNDLPPITSLPLVFSQMEQCKEGGLLEDYSITQTTLDEVLKNN